MEREISSSRYREEWTPSRTDIAELRTKLTRNHPDLKSFGTFFKKTLSQQNLFIGARTFSSGLNVFLLAACRRGRLDIVKYFLKNHAHHFDINARITYLRGSLVDKPPFLSGVAILPQVFNDEAHCLCSSNSLEWHATTLLHVAAVEGYIDVVKALVSAGASVNSLDCCSETPLLKTVKLSPEAIRVTRYLIKHGADLNRKGGNSFTALIHACQLKSKIAPQLISLLLDAGANPNITDSRGYTALHIAAAEGNTEVVKHLLAYGVSPLFSSRHLLQTTPSPLQIADQDCLLIPMYHLLQSKLSNAKNHDYRRLKSMMIGYETYMSAATPPLPSGVALQFMSHSECPSFCKADGFLVEVITIISKWMESDGDSPLLQKCTSLLQESLDVAARTGDFRDKADKHDPKHGAVARLKELLEDKLPSQHDVVWQCLLLAELVGYGLEGTIHLMLRSCACLFKWHRYQEGLLLLQRASLHLLSLLERDGYLLAGSDSCCTLLIRLLNTTLHFIQRYHDRLPYHSWSPLLSSTLTNAADCITVYSRFISSTHPHLVPLCETELLAKGMLDILTYWIAMDEDEEEYKEAVTRLVSRCPTVIDSKNRCSTLLHLALRRKSSERLLTTLLRCGGKEMVNYMDHTGLRPLHLAAYVQVKHPGRNDPRNTFSALLDHGAHIDAVDDGGLTAEQYLLATDSTSNHLLRSYLGHGSIPSLMCLTSQALVSFRVDYQKTTLPAHLKTLVSYHDSHASKLKSLSVL